MIKVSTNLKSARANAEASAWHTPAPYGGAAVRRAGRPSALPTGFAGGACPEGRAIGLEGGPRQDSQNNQE